MNREEDTATTSPLPSTRLFDSTHRSRPGRSPFPPASPVPLPSLPPSQFPVSRTAGDYSTEMTGITNLWAVRSARSLGGKAGAVIRNTMVMRWKLIGQTRMFLARGQEAFELDGLQVDESRFMNVVSFVGGFYFRSST